ncbi:MAG: DNA primase [Firmicutes bacterium]|nr:DNA primase [Bacillota bacterium]
MSQGIPESVIDAIRQQTDLVSLVGEYLTLEKRGKDLVGLCPFHHEKTPSFTVSPDKQLFYCFGCGASGNVFSFIMKLENLTFPEAARLLAARAGIRIPERSKAPAGQDSVKEKLYAMNLLAARYYHHQLINTAGGKKALEYLRERGIGRAASEMFMLGYAPEGWDNLKSFFVKKGYSEQLLIKAGLVTPREKGSGCYDRFRNRLIFPIMNIGGKVVGFGGRTLEEGGTAGPKYLNSPETAVFEKGTVLYGLNLARDAIRREKTAVVVEGYTDVIAAHQAGIKNVVASQGTALTAAQARLLRAQAETVVIAYDADSAGENATWRGLKILQDAGCFVRVAELPAGSDPDSLIRTGGVAAFEKLLKSARYLLEYQLDILRRRYNPAEPEGRRRYMEEVLGLLSQVSNRPEQDFYLKKLAEDVGVSEVVLRAELSKRCQKGRGVNNLPVKDQTNNIDRLEINPAEKMLISLMLQENELINLARQALKLEDFEHDTRKVVEAIWSLEEKCGAVSGEMLIDLFADAQLHALITGLATDPSLQELDAEQAKRAADDCIDKIKQRKLARRRQELLRKLKDMKLNDQARILLREQWQMITGSNRSPYRSGGGEDFNG